MTAPDEVHGLVPYLVAIFAVAAAFVAHLALGTLLGDHATFLLFVLPVFATTVFGGGKPGLLAGLLSIISFALLVSPADRASVTTLVQAALFVLVCAAIGWVGQRLATQQRLASELQRQAEVRADEFRASTEQFRLLLEGATGYAIFLLDAQGRISTWNSGAEQIFGWLADDIIGRESAALRPANASEEATDDLAAAALAGQLTREVWQVRRDGSEFLADVTITPLLDQSGHVSGYAKVIHDVTERRAWQTALQKRERHLESILATVPDAMIVIDASGVVLSFSATAERLFGYREGEIVGRNVSELMPNPDRDRHDGYIKRYLESGVPHIIGIGRIVTGLRADGSTFPMKLSVGEANAEDQRLFTGFVQDLTEKQQFENRIEQMQSELLHVSRLSAMGTMASTLAHELNQPLTAISAYGQAAAGLFDEPGQVDASALKEVLEDMAQQALRAGGIVRRLREFVSRGELNKMIEDLPKLINEASALALVGSRELGVISRFEFDPAATPVLADRVQIQQVLINLMRNSLDAMQDTPRKELSVRTKMLDISTVEVSVCDTGAGLAPELRDRLFTAFASSKETGMGLGLSICRTIVEAHGGRILASNNDAGGTCFAFTLPRAVTVLGPVD